MRAFASLVGLVRRRWPTRPLSGTVVSWYSKSRTLARRLRNSSGRSVRRCKSTMPLTACGCAGSKKKAEDRATAATASSGEGVAATGGSTTNRWVALDSVDAADFSSTRIPAASSAPPIASGEPRSCSCAGTPAPATRASSPTARDLTPSAGAPTPRSATTAAGLAVASRPSAGAASPTAWSPVPAVAPQTPWTDVNVTGAAVAEAWGAASTVREAVSAAPAGCGKEILRHCASVLHASHTFSRERARRPAYSAALALVQRRCRAAGLGATFGGLLVETNPCSRKVQANRGVNVTSWCTK